MPEDHSIDPANLVAFTTEIVSAYVAHNATPAAQIPDLIRFVHGALAGLGQVVATAPAAPLKPAVRIKDSVQPDHIVCLDDGRKLKSMKRHLAGLGMTPHQYRAKWDLPSDYPMVAPSYAAARSALAKGMGLGRKPAGVTVQ